jgi:hypothetical protein
LLARLVIILIIRGIDSYISLQFVDPINKSEK